VGELPANGRPDLCHLLGGTEAVKPRHERRLQACWHSQNRRWKRSGSAACSPFILCFQNRFRHFLHEQRNAVGAFDDILPDVRRQALIAGDAIDHRADLVLCQSIDRERGHVRLSDPRRFELWPERYNE
jgi:hypothetical protein